MQTRRLLAETLRTEPFDRVLRLLERVDGGRPGVVAVLTYHRVANADDAAGYPGLISASPAQFDEQMAFLARRYRVISMADLIDHRDRRGRLPPRAVLVTFDDAYRDFAEHAWPTLRRLLIPVTLFVPTAYPGAPDRGFWWDWLYAAVQGGPRDASFETPVGQVRLSSEEDRANAYRLLRGVVKSRPHAAGMDLVASFADQVGIRQPRGSVLDWPALRALEADGVVLAPHSREHPLLDRVGAAQMEEELRGSWRDLQTQIGDTLPVFAYPGGAHSDDVRAAVERCGFRAAFTTRRGVNDLDHADWLALRRINVGGNSSLNAIRAQIGRWALLWSR